MIGSWLGVRLSQVATVAAVLLAAVVWALPATPAGAQDGGLAEVDIEVLGTIGWENERANRTEAKVTVETARAISGVLVVLDEPAGGSSTTYEFDVDLAAGTSAVFPVSLSTGWDGVEASAELRSGGDVLASDEVREFPDGRGGGDIVAVLGIDDPPRAVSDAGGELQFTVLVVDGSLRGLNGASSLVTTATALRALPADGEAATAIEAWVRGGGQLVIDGPERSLDESFHQFPTANPARFSLGAGSVVYSSQWREQMPLGGYLSGPALARLVENQGLGSGSAGELALLANVALPAALLVAVALLLYSFIAGPVLFGLLSARRARSQIWTILPLLSIGFAVAILGYGFIARSGRTEAHITIVEVSQQGSRATTNLLLTSDFGSSRSISAPAGWTYLGQGRVEGQRPVLVRPAASSTEVAFDMPPGSNAIARFAGTAPSFDGLLTIENVRVDGDQVIADVTNRGDHDLVEAIAFVGNARAEIGDVGAGDTVSVSVDGVDDSGRVMRELLLWPSVEVQWGERGQVAVPLDRDAATAAGAWTEWRIEQGYTISQPNLFTVVGWTDGYSGPLDRIDTGRTALVARANLGTVAAPSGWSLASRLSRGQEARPMGQFNGSTEDHLLTLDPGTDPAELAVKVSVNSAAVSVLIDGEWSWLSLPDGRAVIEIPSAAVIDGEVRIRSHVPDWFWSEPATLEIVVDPEADPAVLTDEPDFRVDGFEPGFGPDAEFEAMEEEFGPGAARNLEQEQLVVITPDLVDGEPFVQQGSIRNQFHHAYTVDLAEGQGMVATMRSGRGDSYLELMGPSGDLVEYNDDFGQNVDSQIAHVAREPGTYEIRAMDLGSGSIDYELTVEVEQ